MRVKTGHINPWWTTEHRDLDYLYIDLRNNPLERDQWYALGYDKMRCKGALYDMSREFPDWANKFLTLFNWKNVGVSFYCMNTADILPLHRDHFIGYKKRHNITDNSTIWRAVVFMEDWKSGHYLDIDNKGYTNWKAGDWVAWNYDIPHMASNIGTDPRYTVQITGTVID